MKTKKLLVTGSGGLIGSECVRLMASEGWNVVGIDNDMLVLSPQAANLTPIENNWMKNKVRVTGTVRALAVAEIEREVGWDLNRKIEAEFKKVKAVLVASSVERLQQ